MRGVDGATWKALDPHTRGTEMHQACIEMFGSKIWCDIANLRDSSALLYSVHSDDWDGGLVLVQPARAGMNPRDGVMLTFGAGTQGGALNLGNFLVRGSVTCTGPDLMPGPASGSPTYVINQVRKDSPPDADYLSALASSMAAIYVMIFDRGL